MNDSFPSLNPMGSTKKPRVSHILPPFSPPDGKTIYVKSLKNLLFAALHKLNQPPSMNIVCPVM